jgi:hypothetical protein
LPSPFTQKRTAFTPDKSPLLPIATPVDKLAHGHGATLRPSLPVKCTPLPTLPPSSTTNAAVEPRLFESADADQGWPALLLLLSKSSSSSASPPETLSALEESPPSPAGLAAVMQPCAKNIRRIGQKRRFFMGAPGEASRGAG